MSAIRVITVGVFGLVGVMELAADTAYSIDWFNHGGGGGPSSGGLYSLVGSVGQPQTGAIQGGDFSLEGGFWAVLVVESAAQIPKLAIATRPGVVTISWSTDATGFVLERSEDLTVPKWNAAPLGNPVSISIEAGAQYFRLRRL